MRASLTVLGVMLALAGCNRAKDVSLENATPAEVAKKLGDAAKLDAGKWRITTKVLNMDMPGVPATEAAAVRANIARSGMASVDTCITPAMASRPPGELFAGSAEQNCTYDHFTVSGGKLDAMMTCKPTAAGGPSQVTVAISGDYGAKKYDLATAMTMTGGGPGGATISMKSRVTGENVGACEAGKAP